MRIRQIGSNMTEVEVGGNTILVSYSTPVAVAIDGKGYFRTSKRFGNNGNTTQRHISKWLARYGRAIADVEEKPQSFFDNLLE